MVGSNVVVGAQTRCALLHLVYNLKVVQVNRQSRLIQKRMLHEFEFSHNGHGSKEKYLCER